MDMIPITIKRIALIVWLLENVDKEFSVLQATKETRVLNYHAIYNALRDLAVGGYLRRTKTRRYRVANAPALVNEITLALPFRLKTMIGFFLGGDMLEKMQHLTSMKIDLVFTLFSGAELLSPYVKTSLVHTYVPQESIENIKDVVLAFGGRRAAVGEADTFFLPTQHNFVFNFSRKRGLFNVAPMGILLADLMSYGGLAQEQANRIMKEWLSGRSYNDNV